MTETEVHVEHEHSEESVAEEVADRVEDVLEEMQEDAEHTESIRQVEAETEQLESRIESHAHSEYAVVGHSHPELDHSERIAVLESRIETIEHGLAEELEEPVIEEIEPTSNPEPEPQPKRRHRFGTR